MASSEIRPRKYTAFFYGTLMAREVLHRVCHGSSKPTPAEYKAFTITPAILHDHCRHRVKYADYPGMIAEKGHSVRGTYVTGLTAAEVLRLDYFEGSEYEKREVHVHLLNGKDGDEEVTTTTYIFIAGEDRLEKREWDFEEFKNEKMPGKWADGSAEYKGVDEAAVDATGEVNKSMNSAEDEKEVLDSAV